METLDLPQTGPLRTLDVDNGLALEDWRASGLGPCAAMLFERQVFGEYPHADEVCTAEKNRFDVYICKTEICSPSGASRDKRKSIDIRTIFRGPRSLRKRFLPYSDCLSLCPVLQSYTIRNSFDIDPCYMHVCTVRLRNICGNPL